MKKVLAAATLIALTTLGSACTKDEVVNNYYAAPDAARTSALGFAMLYDEFGRSFRRHDGSRVTVKGTTPLIEAVTDTNGRYQLDGLQAGNYVLTYSRPGYGAYEQEFMLAAAGGNQPVLVTQNGPFGSSTRQLLYQQATTVASDLLVTTYPGAVYDSDTALVVSGKITPASTTARPRNVAVLFDSVAYLSQQNFIAGFNAGSYNNPIIGNSFRLAFTKRDLKGYSTNYGLFRPGQRYYVRACGVPNNGFSGYMNRQTGLYIFSSFNPQITARRDFVVPN